MLSRIGRLGFIGRVSLALAAAALLTAAVAGMAWLGFSRVVDLQRRIIDDTVPAMEAVRATTQLNTQTLALVGQLGRAQDVDEVDRLRRSGGEQLAQARVLLERLARQRFEPGLAAAAIATLDAMGENLERQATEVRRSLELNQGVRAALSRHQHAVGELMLLAEALAANASTYTTATVSSLYPMLERGAGAAEIVASLDRLIEVDVDRMERMSELQLVCFRLLSGLERVDAERESAALFGLSRQFAADLAVLARRIQDFRDPTRKAAALRHHATLAAGRAPGGLFSLQADRITLGERLDQRRRDGAALAARLDEQGGALLEASRLAVGRVGEGSREAIARGAVGFIAVGAVLLTAVLAALWVIFRHDLLDRLKAMETAVRALMAGRFDVTIRRGPGGHDPLAPLVQALEQFREHAIERQRLEQALIEHRAQLEQQVAARTAELSRSHALLEREVGRHAEARREAEEANRAKNEFLGSLSHELRTPLSGVSGSVQLLRDTQLDARQREYVGMIAYANTTLLETLEDMLGFARVEAGKLRLEPEPFDLVDAIDDMLALQSVAATAKGLALVRDIANDVPRRIVGDRRKLNQVLLNTIGNAIKFTDEGEVTVSVTRAYGTAPDGLRLAFAVRDTGIGIPASQREDVFRPFFQVDDTAHRRQGGTGLGLAICARLVELMGGGIGLESTVGEGTTIRFELPFEPAPEIGSVAVPAQQADEDAEAVRPLDVLVVEDDEINRIVCERYLQRLGHRVRLAVDGPSALELLRRASGTIDCVLLDVNLPGASGFEVARAIRDLDGGRWKALPIVGMSAHVTRETFERQAAAGMAGFLGKPFQRGELSRALARAMEGSAAHGSAIHQLAVSAPAEPADGRGTHDGLLDIAFLSEEAEGPGRSILRQLLPMFRQEAEAASVALRDALARVSLEQVGRLAHQLRSAAANLGFAAVMEDCRRIELAAAQAGSVDAGLPAMLEQLRQDCRLSTHALEDWLGPSTAGAAQGYGDPAPSASR